MTETEVCNVKVAFIRPLGFDNLKKWCENDKNVYIGRKGIVFVKNEDGGKERYPKQDSKWCNPFKVGKGGKGLTREEAVEKYEEYICEKIEKEPEKYNLEELRGKRLGCWCCPESCHGDILKKMVEERKENGEEESKS